MVYWTPIGEIKDSLPLTGTIIMIGGIPNIKNRKIIPLKDVYKDNFLENRRTKIASGEKISNDVIFLEGSWDLHFFPSLIMQSKYLNILCIYLINICNVYEIPRRFREKIEDIYVYDVRSTDILKRLYKERNFVIYELEDSRLEDTYQRAKNNLLIINGKEVTVYNIRDNAARVIQKGCYNWLWKPICKDGSISINTKLGFSNIKTTLKRLDNKSSILN